jgi:hypothetical protein
MKHWYHIGGRSDSDMIDGSFTRQVMIFSQNECFRGLPVGFRTPVKNVYMCGSLLPRG